MSSQSNETQTAETRFRQAFERLKAGVPNVVEPGTRVSQNSIAKEAGRDATALKKARFPTLIREIQAYLELHQPNDEDAAKKAKAKKAIKRSLEERMKDTVIQRDMVQSILASANFRIVELTHEVQSLQRRLDDIQPPPSKLGRW
jgi:hypothetical protein